MNEFLTATHTSSPTASTQLQAAPNIGKLNNGKVGAFGLADHVRYERSS